GNRAHANWKTNGPQMGSDPRGFFRQAETAALRITECAGHADGDRLAMHEPVRIEIGQALQRMREVVAEIKKRSFARLKFVAPDNGGFRFPHLLVCMDGGS